AVRCVFHHSTQPPILPAKVKLQLQPWTEVHILWKSLRVRRPHHLLCRIHRRVWKPSPPIEQVNKIPSLSQLCKRNRQPSPRDHAVRHIPSKRSALLWPQRRRRRQII